MGARQPKGRTRHWPSVTDRRPCGDAALVGAGRPPCLPSVGQQYASSGAGRDTGWPVIAWRVASEGHRPSMSRRSTASAAADDPPAALKAAATRLAPSTQPMASRTLSRSRSGVGRLADSRVPARRHGVVLRDHRTLEGAEDEGRATRSRSLPSGPRSGGRPGPNGGASRELMEAGRDRRRPTGHARPRHRGSARHSRQADPKPAVSVRP